MNAYDLYLNDLLNKNRDKFSACKNIRWMNTSQAMDAQEKRDNLIKNKAFMWYFKDTKPIVNTLSHGCKLCGEGSWSCLFITNKCNAKCFYCPTAQLKDETPATQSLTFENAESYAGYINYFRFKGVSFSGGEPLLFFERTLHYLKTLRKLCRPDLYIWMYTNGILATSEKIRMLADHGLNEIRFDIGATGYRLDKIKLAKNIIQNITIEIPTVPEEKARLKQLLPEMAAAGVTNVNLHQMRLTGHNALNLIKRNYVFIPAEQPVVSASELTALEILNYAQEKDIGIGFNYCSFFYKNRFQQAGFRKILAESLDDPDLTITEKGFIRAYSGNTISYTACSVTEDIPVGNNSHPIQLPHKTIWIKKQAAMSPYSIPIEQKQDLEQLLLKEPSEIPSNSFLFSIWQKEYIERGLRNY